jgi:hypothetical protein
MSAERLTTLAAVKDWLGITTSDSDAGLLRVIDAVSRFTLNYIGRPTLRRATYTQRARGTNKSSVMLAQWPVLEITSVGINGTPLTASTFSNGMPSSGYALSADLPGCRTVNFFGYAFGAVEVTYVAGFEANETVVIPATPFEVTVGDGNLWSSNLTVYIDGVLATEVASAPTAGQYSVDDAGKYTFAAADEGKTALIRYGYVPSDIAFAVTEMVGEWYKRKDRIGVLSKTLGGQETVTYNNQDMSPLVVSSLQDYRNVVSV